MNGNLYYCPICGKLIYLLNESSIDTICCGRPVVKLVANEKESLGEKHLPVISRDGKRVSIKVGEKLHPMTKDHYIRWITVITDKGVHIRELNPDSPAEVEFLIEDEIIEAVYEYCSVHGLWKTVVENNAVSEYGDLSD